MNGGAEEEAERLSFIQCLGKLFPSNNMKAHTVQSFAFLSPLGLGGKIDETPR